MKVYSVLMEYLRDTDKDIPYNRILNTYTSLKAACDYAKETSRIVGPAINLLIYEQFILEEPQEIVIFKTFNEKLAATAKRDMKEKLNAEKEEIPLNNNVDQRTFGRYLKTYVGSD
jgi:hypothetical protein